MPTANTTPTAGPGRDGAVSGAVPRPTAVLRLFASARQAAGTGRAEVEGTTVGDVLDWARAVYGSDFAAVLDASRVWCNGQPAEAATELNDGDEVAVLPPVSGGAGARRSATAPAPG